MNLETGKNRIFGLDVIRAFAIILVVIGHGSFMLKGTVLEGFPYFRMIDGVDIFFVLSGFLIGGILLKEINKDEKFSFSRLTNFWKRRWFRTLPNYYLILLLNYIVVRFEVINEDIKQFNLHFLTFTQNFKSPFYGFFWESWSLSVEEWFYIFTPILIFLLLKLLPPKQSFLISTLIMIILPVIFRLYIYDVSIDNFKWGITFRKIVLCRLDSIGYGLFLAWLYYYFPNLIKKVRIYAFLIGVIVALFIINYNQPPNTFYKQIVYFSLTPFSVMLILPLAESYKKSKGLVAYSVQHVSKISYSMYLINLALVAEVIKDNFAPQGGADGIFKYLLYWLIVIVVSSLLYKYFEKPMMDLRDKKINIFSKIKNEYK